MKQLTSFLLVFALLLSMMPAVFAAGPAEDATSAPDKIDSTTVWRYLDDNTDPAGNPEEEGYDRTGWTAVGFDDSAWKTASGSFGAKNGGAYNSSTDVLLEGCPGTADNYPTYYFRTTVTVADAGAVTKITGSISYDDAAIIYINGIKAAAFNEDGITGNNSYCTNKANTTDAFEITDAGVLSALVNGENVVAVELHNQYQNSSDIWFAMPDMTFSAEPLPATDSLLDGKAQWKYLDDNTDPAAGSDDRTGWTVETFDTTGWKTAIGPFGSKKGAAVLETGYTANTVLDGCNGSSDTPAYFFRTTFTVDSLDGMTKLNGSLQYDDGAIVYINGRRVAAFDDNACDAGGNSLNKGFDANLQYGGSNAGTPKTVSFELLDLSILHVGENTIAVELHNGRATSSDVWFHLTDLSLSDEEVIFQTNISLSVGADESRMNFTWYSVLNNAALTVADNAAMTGAQTVEADTSVANDGLYSCKATATGLNANTTYYYQLSNNGNRSAVYSFTTGGTGAFSFAFVGDPQIGAGSSTTNDAEGWENTLNIIAGNDIFSDVSFLMSAGDQVNTAADENQYDGYLDHDVLTGLPVATAIGNHDSGSNAYGQHFHVPNESEQYGVTAAGGDYYFVYNNALFLVLNSNDQTADGHKAFMELAIEATKDKDIRWKIVMFHHTLFTVANHAHDGYIDNEDGFKNAIIPVLQEMDVDVVLQGHDHVYCRTYMMDGKTPITQSEKYEYDNGTEQAPTAVHDPNGILYVTANSASGSKTYPIRNETFDFSAVQNQDNKGNVSKVTVSDKQFTITTYCVSDMSVVDSFTIKRDGSEAQPAKLLIDQVYGGGSKGDTPIANSFIELYNPTGAAVDLGSYSLVYGDKTLTLNGTIPANGSYLIVGAKETTTDEWLSMALPEADKTCDWVIDNKSYTITLKKKDTEEDSVTAGKSAETKISKQKSLRRNNHGDFELVVWEKSSANVDETYVNTYAPRNSKGEAGKVYTAVSAPTYTPVVAGDVRVNGCYNATGSLKLELAGRYNSEAMNADGGSLEIVQYNPANGFAYAVSGVKGKLIAVNMNGSLGGNTVVALDGTEYDLKTMVHVDGFTYGDMTSVAISPDGTKLAAALQDADYAKPGLVTLFACKADGSLELLCAAYVGVQPDMVTFADNQTILTADEGEPRNGVDGIDPKGSVSIVTVHADNILLSHSVYFDSFDDKRGELTDAGVLVQKGANPSADFEPEYIAVSGDTAYVSLQEANAIAVLDIASKAFTGVYPLGFQDYSMTKVDLQKNDAIEFSNYDNVYGIKMPDGISVATVGGKTYLLTANEGDSRADWNGLDNEYESDISPTGNVTLDKKTVWFNADLWDGLNPDKAYVFGGRSFSIYEVANNGLKPVYDSGSDFETITAKELPDYFNCSNDKITRDNRSGKKGPEPETVITGTVDGKTYAFIALERIGGIMVYDITDPSHATFVNYINSREFDDAIQGDVSPEGLCFVSGRDSKTGNALLLAACEVSGTLAVYELTPAHSGSQNTGSGSHISAVSSDYPVSVISADHGTVTASHPSAAKGTAVTLTIESDEGYTPETVTVTDGSGNKIKLAEKDGKYTFTMPASQVSVEVTFKVAFKEDTAVPNFFADVSADAYYYDAVLWVVKNGITDGTSDTTFSPDALCTRAQLVTFLWRAAGSPTSQAYENPFADVMSDAYYYDAVAWAKQNGIVNGVTENAFAPDDNITREQIAAIMLRYAKYKNCDVRVGENTNILSYTDAESVSAYAIPAVQYAVGSGLMKGKSETTINPLDYATRAEIATILQRFFEANTPDLSDNA